jgi:transcriptional regulator with XRE-family HTH domain
MISLSPSETVAPVERNFGFSRTRDIAFAAVRKLWKLRQAQGMTQQDVAARLDKDPAWVSRKLSGPTNWTLHTLGDLVDALDGEIEIAIGDLREGTKVGNYDAYAGYGEPAVERREQVTRIKQSSESFSEKPARSLSTSTNSERAEVEVFAL